MSGNPKTIIPDPDSPAPRRMSAGTLTITDGEKGTAWSTLPLSDTGPLYIPRPEVCPRCGVTHTGYRDITIMIPGMGTVRTCWGAITKAVVDLGIGEREQKP